MSGSYFAERPPPRENQEQGRGEDFNTYKRTVFANSGLNEDVKLAEPVLAVGVTRAVGMIRQSTTRGFRFLVLVTHMSSRGGVEG